VDQYADALFRFIVKNLRHEEDSRDVVQSAFEKLWINRDQVKMDTVKSYLFTIGYNVMIDHIRKAKRMTYKEDFGEQEKGSVYQSSSAKRVLEEAFNRLNETQKSLVMLKDYEGYNYEEIGSIMNLSESQVKVYLHRARLQLRSYIVDPQNVI
jgi:RNA polymerase sigma-70 factor (ECF subfamily)